jgi:FKBP-type peptidyl-prolyl cis-trans isomerase FkpA
MKQILSACACALAVVFTAVPACVAAEQPAAVVKKIDTVAGTGKTALPGTTVTVHYTGWLHSPKADKEHGAQFDSSVGGAPFTFRLGGGQVIKGWDEGLAGMKVGGKRTIVIPAALGYGSRGAGPIPPNANLIFDVQLIDVR